VVCQVVGGSAAAGRPTAKTKTASLRAARGTRFDQKSLLVRFKQGVSLAERKATLARHGASVKTVVHGTPFSPVHVADAARARRSLEAEPAIAAVELNLVVIGDSHAQMWMPPVLRTASRDGWAVVPFVKPRCIPRSWSSKGECGKWYRWATGRASALHPDVTS
jgi:hypothetical protein